MAVFDAPAQALAAGRAMLAATRRVNPGRAAEERIEVCIGMGYGDMLRVDGDVWGAEVNAASKLGEDTACGGEILVTGCFRSALPHVPFSDCGTVFGTRPVYRFAGPGA